MRILHTYTKQTQIGTYSIGRGKYDPHKKIVAIYQKVHKTSDTPPRLWGKWRIALRQYLTHLHYDDQVIYRDTRKQAVGKSYQHAKHIMRMEEHKK